MKNFGIIHAIVGSLLTAIPVTIAEESPKQADLNRLLSEIKPDPGESPWREIAWLTSVTEARERAVAENKPLVIFTAADGSPLGRT